MENLKVSLLQFSPVWEDPRANQQLVEKYFEASQAQLLVLPEMFSTGFTRHTTDALSENWLKSFAQHKKTHVFASVAVQENNKAFNRGFWVNPEGKIEIYDKKHLFKYGKEHHTFSAGNQTIQPQIQQWAIKPLICYDLRFPVWARNKPPYYDVLIYIASWPKIRRNAWIQLLKARAIENQCYVIGVNRIGIDGYQLEYSGDSCVIDFQGKLILDAQTQDGTFEADLSYSELQNFRSQFPFLEDADPWEFL